MPRAALAAALALSVPASGFFFEPNVPAKVLGSVDFTGKTQPVDGVVVLLETDGGSQYIQGKDSLRLPVPCVSCGLITNIAENFDPATGVLKVTGTGTAESWGKVLNEIVFVTTDTRDNQPPRSVSWNLGTAVYNKQTGHFYDFITATSPTWDQGKTGCEAINMFGMQGYLATIATQQENDFASAKLNGQGWIGSSDAAQEGTWRWVTGPEGLLDGGQGEIFYTDPDNGGTGIVTTPNANGDIQYDGWAAGEPNNAGNEHYGHFLGSGQWNDYNAGNTRIVGYVCEWGGICTGGIPIPPGTCPDIPPAGSAAAQVGCSAAKDPAHCHWHNGSSHPSQKCGWDPAQAKCLPQCRFQYVGPNCDQCPFGFFTQATAPAPGLPITEGWWPPCGSQAVPQSPCGSQIPPGSTTNTDPAGDYQSGADCDRCAVGFVGSPQQPVAYPNATCVPCDIQFHCNGHAFSVTTDARQENCVCDCWKIWVDVGPVQPNGTTGDTYRTGLLGSCALNITPTATPSVSATPTVTLPPFCLLFPGSTVCAESAVGPAWPWLLLLLLVCMCCCAAAAAAWPERRRGDEEVGEDPVPDALPDVADGVNIHVRPADAPQSPGGVVVTAREVPDAVTAPGRSDGITVGVRPAALSDTLSSTAGGSPSLRADAGDGVVIVSAHPHSILF